MGMALISGGGSVPKLVEAQQKGERSKGELSSVTLTSKALPAGKYLFFLNAVAAGGEQSRSSTITVDGVSVGTEYIMSDGNCRVFSGVLNVKQGATAVVHAQSRAKREGSKLNSAACAMSVWKI